MGAKTLESFECSIFELTGASTKLTFYYCSEVLNKVRYLIFWSSYNVQGSLGYYYSP